jgi:Tfp pilus assembly protein FimT
MIKLQPKLSSKKKNPTKSGGKIYPLLKANFKHLSFRSLSGTTINELIIVLGLTSILATLSIMPFRTFRENIACRHIFSAMQLARMRAIVSGFDSYVDFDMNGGSVSDNFYTTYLNTDPLDDCCPASFGELNNTQGRNEFADSQLAMSKTPGGFPGVALPSGVSFGLPPFSPPSSTPTKGRFSRGVLENGVGFARGSKRIKFLPNGTPTGFGGSVYVYNENDNSGRGCAVVVASTGIIRMWTWDGHKWD